MTTLVLKESSPLLAGFDDLTAYFAQGEKPPEQWKMGAEQEKIAFWADTLSPPTFEGPRGIETLLAALRDRFGWEPLTENHRLVSLTRRGAMITLEPGGQLELSGIPQDNAHQTLAEVQAHMEELRQVSRELGLVWLTVSRNPLTPLQDIPWMPKARYAIMGRYLPQKGDLALDMMLATASTQVSLDFSSEADMAQKLRLALAAAPIYTALTANSPFAHGQPTGWQSTRAHIWTRTDPDRCGLPHGVFSGDFGYAAYAAWARATPMFFIYRQGHLVDLAGLPFGQFMDKGHQGHQATQEDWLLHLTTLFPDVRLKTYLELRTMDMGPAAQVAACVALTRGLFYAPHILEQALHLLRGLDAPQYQPAMEQAARAGLQGQMLGRPLLHWAKDLVDLAAQGLRHLNALNPQGQDESALLAPFQETLQEERSPAARLLQAYHGPWHNQVMPLITQAEQEM